MCFICLRIRIETLHLRLLMYTEFSQRKRKILARREGKSSIMENDNLHVRLVHQPHLDHAARHYAYEIQLPKTKKIEKKKNKQKKILDNKLQ